MCGPRPLEVPPPLRARCCARRSLRARASTRLQWLRSKEWTTETAGGCPKHPSWATNPQFQIFPTVEGASYTLPLQQHALHLATPSISTCRPTTAPTARSLSKSHMVTKTKYKAAAKVSQRWSRRPGRWSAHCRGLDLRPAAARPLHADAHLRRGRRRHAHSVAADEVTAAAPPARPAPPPHRPATARRPATTRRRRHRHRRTEAQGVPRFRCHTGATAAPSRATDAAEPSNEVKAEGQGLEKQERDAAALVAAARRRWRAAASRSRTPTSRPGRLARRRLGARAARDPVAPPGRDCADQAGPSRTTGDRGRHIGPRAERVADGGPQHPRRRPRGARRLTHATPRTLTRTHARAQRARARAHTHTRTHAHTCTHAGTPARKHAHSHCRCSIASSSTHGTAPPASTCSASSMRTRARTTTGR